jgi:hypothetical protein
VKVDFTDKRVARLEVPSERLHVYDTRVKGLGLKLETSGLKTWFWYRCVQGKNRWQKLGDFPALNVAAARGAAEEMNGELATAKRTRFAEGNPFKSTGGR